jgi:hypothetical protein
MSSGRRDKSSRGAEAIAMMAAVAMSSHGWRAADDATRAGLRLNRSRRERA